ncbi:MAG TPA: VWA domain-containing protein [Bryobacteraceae bacterium]|nr:VWA domain-containing protein [Bryobacteraceae bacterium]
MRIVSTLTMIVALVASGLSAQTPTPAAPAPDDKASFKAGAEETVLDVVVRDKKGRLVKDLKESDFTVIDNGTPRPVKSFRLVEGTEAINSTGGRMQLDPLRQLRLITLVFQGGDQNAKKLARDAAFELIKGELAQNVYISVMAIDHKLQALQPFTNDRQLLHKAISRATASVNDYTNDTIQVRKDLEQLLGPAQGGDTSATGRANQLTSAAGSASGPGAANSSGAQAAMAQLMVTILKNAQSDESQDWSRASVFPLLDLVKEQYRLPGRKTILYFSGGFPITQSVEDPFKQIISIANRANVSFYNIDINGLTTYSTAGNANSALADAGASSAKNVTSSTTGISTMEAQAADQALDAGKRDTQLTIKMLAEQTGGVLIANTNDFRGAIRKVTEDVQSYYEITYDPQIQKYDGAFRKVVVKTDMADLRVQSRAGYFALPPNLVQGGQMVASYEVPLLQALETQPLKTDFAFQAAAMNFRAANGGICEVVVDIPVGGLTFEENKQAGFFDGKLAYVAVVKDADGQVVKKLRQEVPLRVTPDKLAAYKASSHFIYDESVTLGPGRYTLETAVLDMQSQKMSAKKSSFVIPAPSEQLAVSSASMIRSTKVKDATAKADDPMLMADKVILPMVNPILKKADYDALSFYLTIYPDKKNSEKPSMMMIFSKDGQVLGQAPAPQLGEPDAQGRIQYVATAPASALPPGNWEIRFVAQQGKETADSSVTFTLQ